MPTSLGPAEILVILVVALIVLGPKRLPEAGRQVGKALAEVRRWSKGIQTEIRDAFDTEPEPPLVSSESIASAPETGGPLPTSAPPPVPERPAEGSDTVTPNNGARPDDDPPSQ